MPKQMQKAVSLTAALLLCACAGAPSPASGESSERDLSVSGQESSSADVTEMKTYSIYIGERVYEMDASGRLCGEEERFDFDIIDPLTEECVYRVRTRDEDTGEDDEYGNPVTQRWSALYSADGTLACDWAPYEYSQGIGGLVIRHEPMKWWDMPEENMQSALWDPVSGETVIDKIHNLNPMGNGDFLALSTTGRVMGVLDGEANVVSGFPAPAEVYYPSVESGLIFANFANPYDYDKEKSDQYIVMDRELNTVFSGKYEYFSASFMGLRGSYLLWRTQDAAGILSVPDMEPVTELPNGQDLRYFDGERMILSQGRGFVLCGADGEILCGPYDMLSYEDEYGDSDAAAERFLARSEDTLFLLDRSGKELARVSQPGLDSAWEMQGGLFCYVVQKADRTAAGVLNQEFQTAISASDYESIFRLSTWKNGKAVYHDLLVCSHTLSNGVWRQDLLDLQGNVLMKNLTAVGDAGEGRIAVARGSSVGLIDFEGNWIARHSIYDTLKDD